jgi:hypothetical protein
VASLFAAVFRDAELAGRHVEQRSATYAAVRSACDRHDEGRLPRVEVGAVRQGAGRDDADDLAADEPLRLPRIFDLFADGDAEALANQPRDVAVGRVVRHAAHGDRAAAGVLRPRRERQLEGARGDERVLVEHLVEIAHAEEHDRVAMLAFRVQILAHGRRRGRDSRGGRVGRDGHRG